MKYQTGAFMVIKKKKEKASVTFWFLLLNFHYPLELLAPSVSQLQYPLYMQQILN